VPKFTQIGLRILKKCAVKYSGFDFLGHRYVSERCYNLLWLYT